MKPRETFLQKIHSWPEETRRLMALLSTTLSGIIVIILLSATIQSRLAHPATGNYASRLTPPTHTATLGDADALSPLEGIRDSFASLKGILLPEDSLEDTTTAGGAKELLLNTGVFLHDSLVIIGNHIIGGWLKLWHIAQDPNLQNILTKRIVYGFAALDRGMESISQYLHGPFQ